MCCVQAFGEAGQSGLSKSELKAAVSSITEYHEQRRQAAGSRETTYGTGLYGAGLDFNGQFKKVSINA